MTRKVGASPFFIVGCGRSGTTLVRAILASHPDVAIPGESYFVPSLIRGWRLMLRNGTPDIDKIVFRFGNSFRLMGVDPAEVERHLRAVPVATARDVVEAIFGLYADQRRVVRWGDKTPAYVRHIPLIAGAFPDARFVHVIRDGRNCAASFLEVPFGPNTVLEAAELWRRSIIAGRQGGNAVGPDRYLEVKCEHLTAEPEAEIRRLCAFLDLTFDEAMTAPHLAAGREASSQVGQERLRERIRKNVRDWRKELRPAQIAAFEAVAGETLVACGYELQQMQSPARAWVRRAEARILFGARRVAGRVRRSGVRAKRRIQRAAGRAPTRVR
jgi:hypothetical protein